MDDPTVVVLKSLTVRLFVPIHNCSELTAPKCKDTFRIYRVTQKKTGTFEKIQQKLKKSKKKNLLTEIEPLQLAF